MTGGTGFIGTRFVHDAIAAGYRVRLLTRHPGRLTPGTETRPFDLSAVEPIDPDVLRGCSAVVHIAAYTPANHTHPEEAETCWRLNALGTLRLVQAVEQAGIGRFVHITGANAYAPWTQKPDESAPMFPAERVFYLGSKIAQEIYADFMCSTHGIEITTLRASSVYGSGQPSGAIRTLACKLLRNETVSLSNLGRYGADFVTVGDVSKALLIVLRRGASGTYNIGSGVRSTIAEVAAKLADLTGADPDKLRFEETSTQADQGFPALNITKARALGYRPTSLDQGLLDLVTWLKSTGADRRSG